MSYCLLFPGQGTQFPGMHQGLDLGELDQDLLKLMQEGPDDALSATVNAQPAIVAVSIALWRASGLGAPAMVMGHSLGEYSALVMSGALGRDETVRLVSERGRLMEQAEPGSMAAVMKAGTELILKLIDDIPDVWIANLNGGGQNVLSGRNESLTEAVSRLKEHGARVVPLKVKVASHCPLMQNAATGLAAYLDNVSVQAPACPVIFNATARPETDPAMIKKLLHDQLVSPVRFEESVEYVISQGVDHFVEVGPKSALAGLVKRIAPHAHVETRTVK